MDLSGAYNWVGITYDTDPSPGNLDGDGDSYSATLLGSSVSLNGLSYNIGPPGTNDVLRGGTGQAITLPSGQYSSLDFLGTAVNGHQTGTFIVNYTDGTTQLTQTLDDWTDDLGQSGETLALTMRYRNSNNNPDDTTTVYLYGYSIPLNPAKTVASITLPDGDNGANFEIARDRPYPGDVHRHRNPTGDPDAALGDGDNWGGVRDSAGDLRRGPVRQPGDRRQLHRGDGIAEQRQRPTPGHDDGHGVGRYRDVHQLGG